MNKTTATAMDDRILVTEDGLKALHDELAELQGPRRKEVAERLKEAISYGDLSENAEYEEAKNEQAFVEGRIAELEKMIKNAQLIDEKKAHKSNNAQIGTTVELVLDEKGAKAMTITIVGSTEADPLNNRISNESPLGQAVLGSKEGDTVVVNAPAGKFSYTIKKLS